MASLGKTLQDTIRNLEKIRASQKPPSDDVLAKLDKLYEQQIELIDAAIKNATPEYVKATAALNKAAKATQAAIDDLAKLEKALKMVADAIGLIEQLLIVVAAV